MWRGPRTAYRADAWTGTCQFTNGKGSKGYDEIVGDRTLSAERWSFGLVGLLYRIEVTGCCRLMLDANVCCNSSEVSETKVVPD